MPVALRPSRSVGGTIYTRYIASSNLMSVRDLWRYPLSVSVLRQAEEQHGMTLLLVSFSLVSRFSSSTSYQHSVIHHGCLFQTRILMWMIVCNKTIQLTKWINDNHNIIQKTGEYPLVMLDVVLSNRAETKNLDGREERKLIRWWDFLTGFAIRVS